MNGTRDGDKAVTRCRCGFITRTWLDTSAIEPVRCPMCDRMERVVERHFNMDAAIVIDVFNWDTGLKVDQREESYDTADTGKVAPENVIALTLAGDDEVTDEIVALADRIINDLNLAGFQLSRDGVPGTVMGECARCGEDVRSDEEYMTNGDDPAWVQHEKCYDDD